MKNRNTKNNAPTRPTVNKGRPENKNVLDSRSNEEQLFKGDDITHNRASRHSDRKKLNDRREREG
jgi:hypothetical protein